MGSPGVIHYWAGCPKSANSKWQRFLAVVQHCSEKGWRNYLAWSRMPDDPALAQPFRELGCEIVLLLRSRGNFDWASVWRTYRLLRRLKCDVFHCHNDHTSPLMGAALAGTPVRLWSKLAMSPYYERNESPRGLHRFQMSIRLSCMLAHRVLALSSAVRDELIQSGVAPAKIHVVRGPVALHLFDKQRRDEVRDGLGFKNQDLIITTVGRAAAVKGWDILVEAFAQLTRQVPEARLVLVGSRSADDEKGFCEKIQDRARELNLNGRITWLGQRTDIAGILNASDIFAFPSRSDGQGLALTEAMAARLPCVAANVGGIPEIVESGTNGMLFPRGDAVALAHHLADLAQDPERRQRLGAAARESVSHLGMSQYAEQVVSHYEQLLRVQ